MSRSARSSSGWPTLARSIAWPPAMPAWPAARASRRAQARLQRRRDAAVVGRQHLEGQRLHRVAGEHRLGLAELDVHRRLAAAQHVVVHARHVVVDQRIGVDQLDRAGGAQRGVAHRRGPPRRRRAPAADAAACRRRARRSASHRRGRPAHRREPRRRAPLDAHRARPAPRRRTSVPLHVGGPGLELAVFEHLDLLLDRLEPRAADTRAARRRAGSSRAGGRAATGRASIAATRRSSSLERLFVARGRCGGRAGTRIGRHSDAEKTSIVVSRSGPHLMRPAVATGRPARADGRMPARQSVQAACRTPLGTIRDPSIDAAGEPFASRLAHAVPTTPLEDSPGHVRPERHPRSARASRSPTPGPQLLRSERSSAASWSALFARGPRYLGHELAVPEVGDYYALPQEGEGRALVRTPTGVELISNVCRHRQAVMLRGRGNTGANIVCPLHRWTYDLRGQLIGAPHFADDPCLNLRQLPAADLERPAVRGRRRAGRDVAADLAGIGPRADLDFTGYVLRPRQAARVRLQLEDLHRGLPRGLPRRPVPPRARPVRHLRRPALGVRAAPLGADGRAEERARQAGIAGLPQVARRGAGLPRRALPTRCRATARSGSPTTRR